jgi:hypothetical protein
MLTVEMFTGIPNSKVSLEQFKSQVLKQIEFLEIPIRKQVVATAMRLGGPALRHFDSMVERGDGAVSVEQLFAQLEHVFRRPGENQRLRRELRLLSTSADGGVTTYYQRFVELQCRIDNMEDAETIYCFFSRASTGYSIKAAGRAGQV